MSRPIRISFPQTWVCVCLLILAIVVANLGDAIGKAGRNVARSCQGDIPAHAGPRTP